MSRPHSLPRLPLSLTPSLFEPDTGVLPLHSAETLWPRRYCWRFTIATAAVLVLARTSLANIVPILETYNDSLTTYKPADKSNVQDVRPLFQQRGLNLDGSLRVGGGPPMSLAGNPFGEGWNDNLILAGVRLDTGTFALTDVDLALPAPGFSWVIGRSYNARQRDSQGAYFNSDGYQGKNWFQLSQPEIVLHNDSDDSKDMVYLVYGADRYIEFKRKDGTSNQYKAVNGAAGAMDLQEIEGLPFPIDVLTYTDQRGWKYHFFGFDQDVENIRQGASGQIWKVEAPKPSGGYYTAYVGEGTNPAVALSEGYYDGGRIKKAKDSAEREYTYTYVNNRLITVEAKRSGPVLVARVEYLYCVDTDPDGKAGDLRRVTITTPLTNDDPQAIGSEWLVRKKHYRYYEDPTPHLMKYVMDFEGYRRYDWQDSNWDDDPQVDPVSDSWKQYASASFEYDGDRRISKAWFNGACGCSGSSNGLHEYFYECNGACDQYGGAGYDTSWKSRTIVEQPEAISSYITQYFDEVGQPLHQVRTKLNPSDTSLNQRTWATMVVRNAEGQITSIHSPANVSGYAHSTAQFTTLTSAGLVTVFERIATNHEVGFLKNVRHKKGTTGTAHFDSTVSYAVTTLAVGGVTVARPLLATQWVYTEETDNEAGDGSDPPGAHKTSYVYNFYGGTGETGTPLMVQEIETVFPAVSTAYNGSGSTTTSKVYFDEASRTVWEKTTDGFINYWQYVGSDGQLEKTIEDADTSKPDFGLGCAQPPSATYTGTGGLHRVTCYTYTGGGSGAQPPGGDPCHCSAEAEGDTAQSWAAGATATSYTARLADQRIVTLDFPDWDDATPDKYYGPVTYTVTNHTDQTELDGVIKLTAAFTTALPTAFIDEADADLRDAVAAIGTVAQMTRHHYFQTGQRLEKSWEYSVIPTSGDGVEGVDYDETLYGYDDLGRLTRTKAPTTTIQRTVYDTLGRMTEQWIGTNDDLETGTDNMVRVSALEYDGNGDRGNSYLTKQTDFVQNGAIGQRVTTYQHDLRGNVLLQTNPTAPHVFNKFDNMERLLVSGQYSATSGIDLNTDDPTNETANRLALSQAFYDELGRTWKSQTHKISQTNGTDLDNLQTLNWYDAAWRLVKVDGRQLAKMRYDRLGRVTNEFILAQDDDVAYANAGDVAGDIVLVENQTVFGQGSDDVLMTAVIDRHHDDYSALGQQTTGPLDTNQDTDPLQYTAANIKGRIQITASWYDNLGRVTDTAAYGNNNGTDFDRDPSGGLIVPTRSDTVLVSSYLYNTDGTLKRITDPKDIKTQNEYDAAGRQTKVIRNYDVSGDGTPGGIIGDEDQTVSYQYTDGLLTRMTADLPGTQADQVTEYTYVVTSDPSTDGPSKIDAGHLLRKVVYPPQTVGQTEDNRRVLYAYNAQGEQIWSREQGPVQAQASNVIEADYDDSGRQIPELLTYPPPEMSGFRPALEARGPARQVWRGARGTPSPPAAVHGWRIASSGSFRGRSSGSR